MTAAKKSIQTFLRSFLLIFVDSKKSHKCVAISLESSKFNFRNETNIVDTDNLSVKSIHGFYQKTRSVLRLLFIVPYNWHHHTRVLNGLMTKRLNGSFRQWIWEWISPLAWINSNAAACTYSIYSPTKQMKRKRPARDLAHNNLAGYRRRKSSSCEKKNEENCTKLLFLNCVEDIRFTLSTYI